MRKEFQSVREGWQALSFDLSVSVVAAHFEMIKSTSGKYKSACLEYYSEI